MNQSTVTVVRTNITLSKALGSSSYKLDDVIITTLLINKKESALLLDQKMQ
jgi:hypothetical protein